MPTVAELIEDVRDMLDEEVEGQWKDRQLKKWLNEANRDIARTTHHYKSTDTLTVTADVAEYTMPDYFIAIEQAYYDDLAGMVRPLQAKYYEQMDAVWGSRQGWSGAWPEYFTTWGHAPMLKLRLHPVPSTTGHKVKLLVAILPEDLGADDDQVEVPPAWYDALADYCAWKAFLKDQNPMAEQYRQSYVGKRDQMLHNNEYLAVARQMVPDPASDYGYVAPWLAIPGPW